MPERTSCATPSHGGLPAGIPTRSLTFCIHGVFLYVFARITCKSHGLSKISAVSPFSAALAFPEAYQRLPKSGLFHRETPARKLYPPELQRAHDERSCTTLRPEPHSHTAGSASERRGHESDMPAEPWRLSLPRQDLAAGEGGGAPGAGSRQDLIPHPES